MKLWEVSTQPMVAGLWINTPSKIPSRDVAWVPLYIRTCHIFNYPAWKYFVSKILKQHSHFDMPQKYEAVLYNENWLTSISDKQQLWAFNLFYMKVRFQCTNISCLEKCFVSLQLCTRTTSKKASFFNL